MIDSAFDTDMDAASQWPAPVDIVVRIDYPNGPSEHSRLRIDRSPSAAALRVETAQPRNQAPEVALIRWTDLPGKSLFQRCLHVLAVHLFGSVDMPPRITGSPLWSALALDMTAGVDDPKAWQVDLRSVGAGRAELRFRSRRDVPADPTGVTLEALDADPLRALLRLSIARVKPTTPRSRGAAGKAATASATSKPPSRIDVKTVGEAL